MVFDPSQPMTVANLMAYLRQAQSMQGAREQQNPLNSALNGAIKGGLRKGIVHLLGGGGATEASQMAWNAPGLEATNAAWNAPAMAESNMASVMNPATEQLYTPISEGADLASSGLTGASELGEGGITASGYMAEAAPYLPYAGAVAGAIMAQKGFEGAARNMKANHGDLSTRDIAKGIYGDNVIGRAMGSLGDIPVIGDAVGSIFRPFIGKRTLAEDRRKKALAEAGYKYLGDPSTYEKDTHYDRWEEGKKRYEQDIAKYGADFVGMTDNGRWANNKFFNSHDEKDLKPEDIVGYAAFAEKYGNDWMEKMSAQDRLNEAQKVLEAGAAREHHGTIDIDWNKVGSYQSQTKTPVVNQTSISNLMPATPPAPGALLSALQARQDTYRKALGQLYDDVG